MTVFLYSYLSFKPVGIISNICLKPLKITYFGHKIKQNKIDHFFIQLTNQIGKKYIYKCIKLGLTFTIYKGNISKLFILLKYKVAQLHHNIFLLRPGWPTFWVLFYCMFQRFRPRMHNWS